MTQIDGPTLFYSPFVGRLKVRAYPNGVFTLSQDRIHNWVGTGLICLMEAFGVVFLVLCLNAPQFLQRDARTFAILVLLGIFATTTMVVPTVLVLLMPHVKLVFDKRDDLLIAKKYFLGIPYRRKRFALSQTFIQVIERPYLDYGTPKATTHGLSQEVLAAFLKVSFTHSYASHPPIRAIAWSVAAFDKRHNDCEHLISTKKKEVLDDTIRQFYKVASRFVEIKGTGLETPAF